jgi:membrane associated rhomboid family serine protease
MWAPAPLRLNPRQPDHVLNQPSEPMLNVPRVVLAILALLGLVHAVRMLVLTENQDIEFLLHFAFIPARYDTGLLLGGAYPGGLGAQIWTFLTYSLIHADLMHLGFNAAWMLPFGSALARRFGTARFLGFMAVTSAAAAGLHLATHFGERVPMIGASGAISGAMAGAIRFAFQRGGPLGMLRLGDDISYHVPAAPLSMALRDPRILAFLGVWFGFNLLFGVGAVMLTGEGQSVAWQAHIGGFLAGLLLFSSFDPIPAHGIDGPDAERTVQ